jgi:hypothetical protein
MRTGQGIGERGWEEQRSREWGGGWETGKREGRRGLGNTLLGGGGKAKVVGVGNEARFNGVCVCFGSVSISSSSNNNSNNTSSRREQQQP